MSENNMMPPALPPRKAPSNPAEGTLPAASTALEYVPPMAMGTPPPLPARNPPQPTSTPLAPPLPIISAIQTIPVLETVDGISRQPRPISVEITPATPQGLSPISARPSPISPVVPGSIPRDPPQTAMPPVPPPRDMEIQDPPMTAPARLEIPDHESAPTIPPPLPRRPVAPSTTTADTTAGPADGTSVPTIWIALAAAGIVLAYLRWVPLWLILIGVGTAGMMFQPTTAKRIEVEAHDPVLGKDRENMKHAVGWVNHLLYALFPLISTDVLIPFIDLLEDALLQQIPPIVTSVRLEAPALGSQPLLLTSLRTMTDEEWYAAVSKPTPKAGKPDSGGLGSDLGRSKSRGLVDKLRGHRRGKSDSISAPSGLGAEGGGATGGLGRLRSSSGSSSIVSAADEVGVRNETEKRRRRDRVLRRVKRSKDNLRSPLSPDTPTPPPTSPDPNSTDVTGFGSGDEEDKEEEEAGQYVNFQVGFSYTRPESTKDRRGYGLHVLGYFGIGVKGIGRTELPVYIDMLGISGMINVRILLSATPPFARTATVSFPRLPEFDISAKPLTRSTFNAMSLPGMKPYVQASIADVARTFVRPESYTLDIDRLLLGREAAFRTTSIGVLHIIIHSAEGLPKVDTMGTCDPYVAVGFAKYHKPMFSTRTIIDNQNPSWEEPAFVLVTSDEIESGESLRLRICDADRFSADDAVGIVEVELADLLDISSSAPHSDPIRRTDLLQADKPGMRVSGSLTWSVRFAPIWQMPQEEVQRRLEEKVHKKRKGDCEDAEPWWFPWVEKLVGDRPEWVGARDERRKETQAWFTGERERDEMEVMEKPNEELRSGVLQFHIHQCVDLEIESLEGTYSASSSARKSAAGGRPALADVIDRTAAENPEPPSAYVEVHLNDRMVFRTRTKQVTPLPYFNAVSERFLRDWRMAKLVFVVRDERDREHDPILGIVTLRLGDVFKDRSQFTRWYPLVGGLGWGRIRISLLWKPVDIHLPPRVSAFEVATLEIKSLAATDLSHLADKKGISVLLETEADKFVLSSDTSDTVNNRNSLSLSPSGPSTTTSPRSPSFPPGISSPRTSTSVADGEVAEGEMEWDITRPIRLAVEYRHSCSVLLSFFTRHGVMRKKRVVGLASVRLNDVEDNQDITRNIPIFGTSSVKDAIIASQQYTEIQSGSNGTGTSAPRKDVPILGFVALEMILRPGVSKAHRKLAKKDLRFKRVYEAWEADRDVRLGMSRKEEEGAEGEDGSSGEEMSGSEDEGEGEAKVKRTPSGKSVAGFSQRSGVSGNSAVDDGDETEEGFMSKRRAHSKALHKGHKGIFQLKVARTGKFVKDMVEAKLYTRANDRRVRGADLDVEQEGQSKL